MLLGLGLIEFIDEPGGGIEPHLPALLAGEQPQADGKVGLASACVANSDDVLLGADIFPTAEVPLALTTKCVRISKKKLMGRR